MPLTLASKENLSKHRYRPGAPMQPGVWRRIRVRRRTPRKQANIRRRRWVSKVGVEWQS